MLSGCRRRRRPLLLEDADDHATRLPLIVIVLPERVLPLEERVDDVGPDDARRRVAWRTSISVMFRPSCIVQLLQIA